LWINQAHGVLSTGHSSWPWKPENQTLPAKSALFPVYPHQFFWILLRVLRVGLTTTARSRLSLGFLKFHLLPVFQATEATAQEAVKGTTVHMDCRYASGGTHGDSLRVPRVNSSDIPVVLKVWKRWKQA